MLLTNKHNESPNNAILGIAQKFILSRVLMMFAELQLGKILDNGPISLAEIAKLLNVHPLALKRFLRLLTAHDIVLDLGNDRYESTNMSCDFYKILNAKLIDDYNSLDNALDALKSDKKIFSEDFNISLCEYLNKYLTESTKDGLLKMAHEFILAKTVMNAAEIGLDTLLRQEPLSSDEIASKLGISSQIIKTYLQILSQQGIVEEPTANFYKSTPLSDCFNRILSPHILDGYKVFNGALHTLQTNTGAWERVFGKSFYEYLNQNNDKLQMFKEWCILSAIDWLPPIVSFCNFPSAKILVDVGGGGGQFAASVLQKNPHMNAVLFDQPSIIAGTDKSEVFKVLHDRIHFVGGDFFQSIPTGGDIYTICRTLLNWDDERAIQIINNCHTAMNGKGKLWIIDFLVPSPDHPKYPRAVINDISLFVLLNSAIRTEQEWRTLLSKTLFTVSNITITQDDIKPEPYYPMCIIEAIPR